MAGRRSPPNTVDQRLRQILHISDVHFGPPHLEQVSGGVHELARRHTPDLVVVSGDLTQRARPEQFQQARAFVDRFTVPTLAVPGNHDVPMYRFWERLFTPFGAYRSHFASELEPTFEDDELVVIGVNTAYNWTVRDGRITRAGLRRLSSLLDGAAPGESTPGESTPGESTPGESTPGESTPGRTKIVVAHHPMVPVPRFDTRRVLGNAHAMVELLVDSGVELVLSGHLHQAWISTTEAYYPSGRRPVLLAHSGTTTSSRGRASERQRNTCNWIRLDQEHIEISHLDWHGGGGRFQVRSRHRYPRRNRESYALETF